VKNVRLLHVEDDVVQQRMVSINLRRLENHQFQITPVISEDEAVDAFGRQGADLVILDYHLAQGNGLSVLERIRRQDALVPVIAVSNEADAETAAKLVLAGADDFIRKRDLTGATLGASVQAALQRAEQARQRLAPHRGRLEAAYSRLCAELLGPCLQVTTLLDAFELEARRAGPEGVLQLLEAIEPGPLRPALLELRERLLLHSRTPEATTRPSFSTKAP
jgi:DNA-binding response OmpR family regulator